MDDIIVGNVLRTPLSAIADNAAMTVTAAAAQRAVCVAPDGCVTVELPSEAVEDDTVGVYLGGARIDLWRQIHGDIQAHIAARPIERTARRAA